MPVPNQTPNGVTFDTPLHQATTVSVPAGVTFDGPTTQPTTVTTGGQPAAQSQPQPYKPTASISAVPEPENVAGRVEQWADDVKNDLLNGTGNTRIGALLKFLGAPGLERGVSPGTAEFMGSPLLGPTRVVKGAAELGQSGKRWAGTKDVVGGALDAATIPGGFIAPEGGEVAGTAIDATATQAARAAKAVRDAVTKPLDAHSHQQALQQGIRGVLDTIAKDAGVTPSPSASIRDVAGRVADSILTRSKAAYQSLDKATDGRFQRFDDALKNVNERLREVAGLDDENESALLKRKAEIEQSQAETFEQAKQAGVDPKIIDSARADWKQAQALYDLDRQLKMSASGMRPELASPGSTPEVIDAKKAFTRLNRLYDSGRLQQAAGQHADTLIQQIDAAWLHSQKIAARQRAIKAAAKAAGVGAAGTAGYESVKALGNQ
ncbi:MAG: hypothetical protein JSS95_07010 [Acidobacteria bacterium]|nr:hypothetical protein [Acidobacteriota bacterium]